MKKFIVFLALFFAMSCSGISMIATDGKKAEVVDTSKFYKQEFLQQINTIKEKYRGGKADQALGELAKMDEGQLSDAEIATKRNLMGVINFSLRKYEVASNYFSDAVSLAKADPALLAQAHLNLGSTYYKMNQYERALSTLSAANYKNLHDSEAKKYHQLYAMLAQQLGHKEQTLASLIRALGDKKTINDLTADIKFTESEEIYKRLSNREKVSLLEDFDSEENLAIAYFAYKEAELAFKNGDRSRMQDYSNWIEKRYKNNAEIMGLVSSLATRVQNNRVRINSRHIGIAIPLSGDLRGLGERALAGIDVAIEMLTQGKNYKIEIKDTKGNPAQGAFAVKDLIEKNNVSAIIGGLNSAEATKEYLEAKKYGVLFISLSKVLLPKEEKNHLLIEIPSSIESQVSHLFNPNMLKTIGQRPAILYPRTDIGEAYANEFWRQAKKNGLDITGLISFDTSLRDFREPVKNLLGIKFSREREVENTLVAEISKLESRKNVKRLQNLQPQINFDWVFVPTIPREAVQILPNFNYFDAFNLNYVGVPGWRSSLMLNEAYRYGNVYFMDEPISQEETAFTQHFFQKFKKGPNFVEIIGFDAFKLLVDVIESSGDLNTRQEIDLALIKKEVLNAESGEWKLVDDLWLKNMNTFRIRRDRVDQILQ